ncbi:hypothetical protein C882_4348 [Caenispirillum salinarum AK4]|uniref:DUF1080 domain-containing protein n=1 Tax=Caenispirillum salinarum AK4 TaxID=1238182 RepID=K9H020_9PROT|nr:hypothetical protein [Caenispirillum salinarum]EKV30389.1 hypothetical protein C882_4348 [Caenispirillum salinarum AK4]
MRTLFAAILVALSLAWAVPASASGPTGSIMYKEQGGNDTYQVFIQNGKVISGWAGGEGEPRYAIVGGWYDGTRLVVVLQGNGFNTDSQWFTHVIHMRRDGRKLWLELAAYGYGKTKTSKPVPYVITQTSGGL